MKPENAVKWYFRSSVLYLFGVWTMLGCHRYYLKRTGRLDDIPVYEEENPNMHVVYESKRLKTVVIMKENFVPYSTRIHRFITSFTGQTNAPQDSESSVNRYGDVIDTSDD